MLIPVLHRILVRPDSVEEADDLLRRAKAAGIEIQLDKREQAAVEQGTVLRIGSTAFLDLGGQSDLIKEGDRVYFAKYAGKPVKEKEESLLLLNDEDIVAIIKEDV